jgi:hypothetical protein
MLHVVPGYFTAQEQLVFSLVYCLLGVAARQIVSGVLFRLGPESLYQWRLFGYWPGPCDSSNMRVRWQRGLFVSTVPGERNLCKSVCRPRCRGIVGVVCRAALVDVVSLRQVAQHGSVGLLKLSALHSRP